MILIKFYKRFWDMLRAHVKTCTARTKKYGEKGDIFTTPYGGKFQLTHVERVTLLFISEHFFRKEGFGSPSEFVDCWVEIHPRAGWTPDKKVWLHCFRRISDA